MSVYDRNMFRGSRPTQMLMKKAGEKVMSDAMGGIAAAKDPVELMNAMRGDERTMKERRQELGGIVGMKDANKTPESVVTLVQPVMQMREAQAPVDQGIGQVAQRAMDTPVTKEMTQGIVQKFAPGGEVRKQTLTQPLMNAIQQGMAGGGKRTAPSSPSSMMDFYNKNLELARQIYGGDEEADRKQALANLLLGGLAPAGLKIAQGVPIAEALMPIGELLATSGASVREAKNKREAAAKAAALDLASDQLTAAREARQPIKLGKNETLLGAPDARGKRPVLATGMGEPFELVSLMNKDGDIATASSREEEAKIRGEGYVFTPDRDPSKEYEVVYQLSKTDPRGFITKEVEKGTKSPEGFSRSKPETGGFDLRLNTKTKKLVSGSNLYFSQQDPGTFVKPGPQTVIDVFDKTTGEPKKITFSEYQAAPDSVTLIDPNKTETIYLNKPTVIDGVKYPAGAANVTKAQKNSLQPNQYTLVDTRDTSPDTKAKVTTGQIELLGQVYKAGEDVPTLSQQEFRNLPDEKKRLLVDKDVYEGDKLSTPQAVFKLVDGQRVEKIAFTNKDLRDFVAQGFSTITPENFTTMRMVQPNPGGGFNTAYAKSLEEMNELTVLGYQPFDNDMIKTLGNKAIMLFPTGSVVLASQFDPVVAFNDNGKSKLIKSDEELLAALNPDQPGGAYYRTDPPSKDVTKKNAYANIQPLALKLDAWASGQDQEWTQQMQMDFDTNLAAIQSSSVLVPNPDGSGGVVVQKNAVPDYVIGAIAKARQKDPNFSDYGLLPPETEPFESVVARFRKPNIILSAEESGINMEDAIGFGDWMSRTLVDGGFGVLVEAFGGNFIPINPESADAVESMNYLMNQTKTAALKELAGKDSEGLRREIDSLLFSPGNPFLTTQKVRNNSKKMTARLQDAIDLKQSALADPLTSQDRVESLKDSIRELTQLQANWNQLYDNFVGTGQSQGSANQLRRNTQPLGDF